MNKIFKPDQWLRELKLGNEVQLTAVQEAVLKNLPFDGNTLIIAPTGTGKTLAFLMGLALHPDFENLHKQILIVAPTRELCTQLLQVYQSVHPPHHGILIVGGKSVNTDENRLKENPKVIIGTPGRLAHHLREGNWKPEQLQAWVLDEFDKTLEMGFHDELKEIADHLPLSPKLFVSATNIENIPEFMNVGELTQIEVLPEKSAVDFHWIETDSGEKPEGLVALLQQTCGKTLVFCNHREACERLAELSAHMNVTTLHGGLEQRDRERRLLLFRNGTIDILICTDVAARGLDITGIQNVIHYQMPLDAAVETHRNGRVGRMQFAGKVFYLATNEEELSNKSIEFCEFIPEKERELPQWQTMYISGGKKDKLRKLDILGFLTQSGELKGEDIGNIDVQERSSFVAIRYPLLNKKMNLWKGQKIKGKKFKMAVAQV